MTSDECRVGGYCNGLLGSRQGVFDEGWGRDYPGRALRGRILGFGGYPRRARRVTNFGVWEDYPRRARRVTNFGVWEDYPRRTRRVTNFGRWEDYPLRALRVTNFGRLAVYVTSIILMQDDSGIATFFVEVFVWFSGVVRRVLWLWPRVWPGWCGRSSVSGVGWDAVRVFGRVTFSILLPQLPRLPHLPRRQSWETVCLALALISAFSAPNLPLFCPFCPFCPRPLRLRPSAGSGQAQDGVRDVWPDGAENL